MWYFHIKRIIRDRG